jgi:hypothetical protein
MMADCTWFMHQWGIWKRYEMSTGLYYRMFQQRECLHCGLARIRVISEHATDRAAFEPKELKP